MCVISLYFKDMYILDPTPAITFLLQPSAVGAAGDDLEVSIVKLKSCCGLFTSSVQAHLEALVVNPAKQANKRANKRANERANEQASKQASKKASKRELHILHLYIANQFPKCCPS